MAEGPETRVGPGLTEELGVGVPSSLQAQEYTHI